MAECVTDQTVECLGAALLPLPAGWDGSIPKELGKLHRLESLLLYDNELTGEGVY